MSTSAWIMLVLHISLFMYLRKKIARRKRELEVDNARLIAENKQLQGKLNYYIRQLNGSK